MNDEHASTYHRSTNMLSLSAGGQTTISIDIHRRYPRAYIHRHSLQTAGTRPRGFQTQGPSEIYHFVNEITTMVKGYKDADGKPASVLVENRAQTTRSPASYYVPRKQIFKKPPHFTADNHFSGDNVMRFIGERGFGITMTCRRDRLPEGLKPYLHHEKKEASDPRQKVMKFQQPIVAVKQVEAPTPAPAPPTTVTTTTTPTAMPHKPYTMTVVSFQSTSSTNITGVNNLPSLSLYVDERSRGRKGHIRKWGIEMNEARETYLKHYSGVDAADHMIQNAGIRYVTWKYWHAPYRHALSLGVIACYDMYIECCEGGLDPEWKVKEKERMNFSTFRFKLSKQMMGYAPSDNIYSGDDKFRESTKKHKKRRAGDDESRESFPDTGVTMDNLRLARSNGRFCDTIEEIQTHFEAIVNTNNASLCEVCGRKCYWKCGRCGKFMCATQGRKWHGAQCAFIYHKEGFFGLSRSDWTEVQGKKQDATQKWTPPTEERIARNTRAIERMKARH